MKRDTLIDIFKDIAQITIATLLIQPVFNDDHVSILILVLGLVVSIYFWGLSLLLSR